MSRLLKKTLDIGNRKAVYYTIMAAIFCLVFLCLGERGYLLWKDSQAYLAFDGRVGIMPLYPLYLHMNRMLFGENLYLYAAVAGQTVLAGVCIFVFTEYIRRKFCLSYLASYPVFLFAMFMPFTVNYPQSISNHDILTESVAYPLFYLYMVFFLKSIFDKKYQDLVFLVLFSVVLALTRTQLQLIGALNAAAFFYVAWMKGRHYRISRQLARGVVLVIAAAFVVIAGEVLILGANSVGQSVIAAMNRSAVEEGKDSSKSTEVQAAEAQTVESMEEVKATETIDTVGTETEAASAAGADISNVVNQYGHLLIDKAFYEIEEDDYLLFEEPQMQELCRAIYEAADAEQNRYVYARNGLWMWEDIMNGIAGGTHVAGLGWAAYLEENPDTTLTYTAVNEIAATLAVEHLGRIVYHTLRMMPPGFICTVFFQKSSVYLLCHIITLIIYASAAVLVIWGYRQKEIPRIYPEFLLGCIVVNVLFVLIMTVMFFAMQRYLVYCFGIFYVAYYLMAVKLVQFYFPKWRKKEDGIEKEIDVAGLA